MVSHVSKRIAAQSVIVLMTCPAEAPMLGVMSASRTPALAIARTRSPNQTTSQRLSISLHQTADVTWIEADAHLCIVRLDPSARCMVRSC
jgi:hypothetical protein